MVDPKMIQMKTTNGILCIHDPSKFHVTGIKLLDLFEHDQDIELT